MPNPTSNPQSVEVTTKQLREQLGSVFILALSPDSPERKIAKQVADNASYLRGKEAFERAATALRGLPNSTSGDRVSLNLPDGSRTAAGDIVQAWKNAAANRDSLFDERGATGQTLLVVQIDGIDERALWNEDADREPIVVRGGANAKLSLFETPPSLNVNKRPDPQNGVLQTLSGDAVSIKRRGNTSRWDTKVNLCVQLDDDETSGFPKQINLNNCIRDPSYQRMRLAWSLFDEARCPVQPCAYAELTLNGVYRGTYVALAPMDLYYFRKQFPKVKERAVFRGQYGDIPGGATLEDRGNQGKNYFSASRKEARTYEPRLDTTEESYDFLAQFIHTLHHSADPKQPAFAKAMESIFDVATFLRVMAVVNLIGSWDAYYLNAQNYFLHIACGNTSGDQSVSFCPYDQDSVLGVSWPGQKRNWQDKDLLFRGKEIGKPALLLRILQNPRFVNYYLDFMQWFVVSRFTVERLAAKKTTLWKMLELSVYLESDNPYGATKTCRPWTNDQVYRHAVGDEQFDVSSGIVAGLQVTGILKFVEARRKKILAQLTTEKTGLSGVDFESRDWSLR